jgi:hypothetical protein
VATLIGSHSERARELVAVAHPISAANWRLSRMYGDDGRRSRIRTGCVKSGARCRYLEPGGRHPPFAHTRQTLNCRYFRFRG